MKVPADQGLVKLRCLMVVEQARLPIQPDRGADLGLVEWVRTLLFARQVLLVDVGSVFGIAL